MSSSDLISGSWDNFRKNFRMYATFVVWYTLIVILEWAIWMLISAMVADRVMRDIVFATSSLPALFVGFMLSVMIIDVTAKSIQKKPIDYRASLSTAFHRVFPFIWVIFLSALAVVFGLVLLIIPFIIFAVWFRFAQDFVVVDDVRGIAAFKASMRLSKGRWGAVATRIFVPVIFFGVADSFIRAIIFLIVGTASGSPGLLFSTTASLETLSISQGLITTVVPQIITAFVLPLFVGADLLLWFDLKRRS
jgi:hypothetical protein